MELDFYCGSAGIDERSRTASGGFTAVRTAAAPTRRRRHNRLRRRIPRRRKPQPAPAQASHRLRPRRQRQPAPAPLPAPTTMDQVVNLFIEREHGLIKMLANRTPVVETYLQNLTSDPQLGPGAQRGPLLPRPHGYGRNRRPQGLSEGRRQGRHASAPARAACRSSTRCSTSRWASPGWSTPTAPTSTASTTTFTTCAANFWATCAAWCSTSRRSRSPAVAASWAASGSKTRTSTSCA